MAVAQPAPAAQDDGREGRHRPPHHHRTRRRSSASTASCVPLQTCRRSPRSRPSSSATRAHRRAEAPVRGEPRARLLLRHQGPGPLPRQHLHAARRGGRRVSARSRSRSATSRSSGLPPVVAELCDKPRGLVLVTGPTGLRQVDDARGDDRQDQHRAPRAHRSRSRTRSSTCTRTRTAWSTSASCARTPTRFKNALRAVLRQDPDVVLIGEMRDLETIEAALRIAETGHLDLRHPAHQLGGPDHQPHRRRVPGRTSSRRSAPSSRSCSRAIMCQSAAPARRAAPGRALAMEILVPNAAIRNLIREDKIHQIYSHDADRPGEVRHADVQPVAWPACTSRSRSSLQTALGDQLDARRAAGHDQPRRRPVHAAGRRPAPRASGGSLDAPEEESLDACLRLERQDPRRQGGRPASASAENKEAVMALLRRDQILVSSVKEKGKEIALPKFGGGVPAKDLAIFTRQFSAMIDAGLPLVQCLEILGSQQENKTFAKILQQTRMDVEGGATPRRRDAQAPQGLRRPLRQHDRGRRGGRYPRHHPEAPRDLHREGGQAQGPGQGRDGLPDRGHLASPASSSRSSCGRSSRSSRPCSRASGAAAAAAHAHRHRAVELVRAPAAVHGRRRHRRSCFAFKRYYATYGGRRVVDRMRPEAARSSASLMRKIAVARFCRTLGTLHRLGRAHPRRPRDHGAHRRQRDHRGRDHGRAQGRGERHHRGRAAGGERRLPADGRADDRRRRADRRPRRDAHARSPTSTRKRSTWRWPTC